jgi:outer membrane cobalamin receptor
MRRRALLILLIAAAFLSLDAYIGQRDWTTLIMGNVIDEKGNPVAGAVITDGKQQSVSAEDGSFELRDTEKVIFVHRIGYLPESFRCHQGLVNLPFVVLKRDPILLPTVKVKGTALDIFNTSADKATIPIDPDRQYYSTAEMLDQAAGLASQDSRLKGEKQTLSILGNLSRHTLVVLDGVPLNPNGESFDLSLLDAQNIESIEVIKNNASVYGGASAIGGVVLIKTRQGEFKTDRDFTVNSELGSYGYARASVLASLSQPRWNFWAKASKFSTDNDFKYEIEDWWPADSVGIRKNNAKRQNSLAGNLNARLGSSQLVLQSEYDDFYRQLPGTVNFSEVYRHACLEGFASRNRITLNTWLLGLDANALAWFNQDNTVYDNTSAPLPVYLNRYRQKLYSYGLRGSLGDRTEIVEGLTLDTGFLAEAGGHQYRYLDLLQNGQDISARTLFTDLTGKARFSFNPGNWIIKWAAAGRYDRVGSEKNLTWRAEGSATWFGPVDIAMGGTIGTSFALPSPYDLYWKGDSQAIGNPDLDSETSLGWQLWGKLGIGRLRYKIAAHDNSIENLIQWRQVQLFGNAWKPMNIGKARIRNLEQEASFEAWDWLILQGNLLLTEALDISTLPEAEAPRLMYTPRYQASGSARYSRNGLALWISFALTGTQETTPDNLTGTLDPYSLVDMGISYRFTSAAWELTPYLNVLNLLDRSYEVYAYTPQPGISFYGGITLKLKG